MLQIGNGEACRNWSNSELPKNLNNALSENDLIDGQGKLDNYFTLEPPHFLQVTSPEPLHILQSDEQPKNVTYFAHLSQPRPLHLGHLSVNNPIGNYSFGLL